MQFQKVWKIALSIEFEWPNQLLQRGTQFKFFATRWNWKITQNWVPGGKIWFGHSLSNLPKKPPSQVNILMGLRVQHWLHPNPNRINCVRLAGILCKYLSKTSRWLDSCWRARLSSYDSRLTLFDFKTRMICESWHLVISRENLIELFEFEMNCAKIQALR